MIDDFIRNVAFRKIFVEERVQFRVLPSCDDPDFADPWSEYVQRGYTEKDLSVVLVTLPPGNIFPVEYVLIFYVFCFLRNESRILSVNPGDYSIDILSR